ncbi:MAG: hypothetical protein R6V57_15830 [Vicinamibacterales bacterium]
MTESIRAGLTAALRNPKLVWLLWAWYGLLALVPALPAWTWWNGVLGSSPEAASVLTRFDLGVFLDLAGSPGVNGLGLLAGAAAAAAGIALVSSAFAFGGILEVFGSADEPRSFMHRFFRGGGHFFWRFFRLALIASVCLVLATGAVSAFMTGVTAPIGESEWEPAGYLLGVANLAAVLAVAALFLLALDYARIRVSRDDSRGMLKAYASGLGFVLRRLVSAYGIAIPFIAALAALVVLYLAYETNAPAAGSWGAIALLFLVQQIVVIGRVFLRVGLAGAERHFHVMALPKPVPAVIDEVPATADAAPDQSLPSEGVRIPTI